MLLNEALTTIASKIGVDAETLIGYANEDTHGARDTGDHQAMAIFRDEGRILYALVRALRPSLCVEIGTADGGSASHILLALQANKKGKLISIDLEAGSGSRIPDELRDRWQFIQGDALTIDLPEKADFVFEDGAHSYEFTRDMLTRLRTLNPKALLSHDYYTHRVYEGFAVEQAFAEAFGDEQFGVEVDGAFTGLGVWINPAR